MSARVALPIALLLRASVSCSWLVVTVESLNAIVASKVAADACRLPLRDRSELYGSLTAGFCVLSFILLVIRLITCQMKFHLDDVMVVVAWLLSMPASVLAGYLAKYGMGRDIWEVPPAEIDDYFFILYLAISTFFVATALVKIALLTFYVRIFPSRNFRIVAWSLVTFIVLWGTGTTFTVVFQCSPIDYTWHQADPGRTGKCLPLAPLVITHAALTLFSDLAILVLPMPTLYKLHVNWKKKLQIFGERPSSLPEALRHSRQQWSWSHRMAKSSQWTNADVSLL